MNFVDSRCIDSAYPLVVAFAGQSSGCTPRERAVSLYYLVRDKIRYDPYTIDLSNAGMRASTVVDKGYGWCVTKAALLAACARVFDIPARLSFSDVRNHLSTAQMSEMLKSDVFIWHGCTELQIDDCWIKSTPAFNIELCERFGFAPLDWDGRSDSIYHSFDSTGHRHMEYLRDRGHFDDIPVARIKADFAETYPNWHPIDDIGQFDRDLDKELK